MRFTFCFLVLGFCFGCATREQAPPKAERILDSLSIALDFRIRAGQFYEADQLDSALALYTLATQYNRNDKHAWHGVATTLGRLGRHNEAGPAYDEALRIDPNYVRAIWHRACGHANVFEKDSALADLRRAIELDSTVKQGAQEDKCFDWLWADAEFLALVE